MALVLTLDGTDLSTKGIHASGVPSDWRSPPRFNRISHRVPTSPRGYGAVVADIPARRLRIPFSVTDSALSLTTIRAAEDWLLTKQGSLVSLQVAASGISTRIIRGYLDEVRITPKATWETPGSSLEIELTCDDATWKATSNTSESINGTPNALSLGTAPVADWVLTITATGGSLVGVTVTLGGDTLVFTGTIASGKSLVVNSEACTVLNDGVNAFAEWSGGFPILLPAGAPAVSAVKGSGAGTLGGSLVYPQAFW